MGQDALCRLFDDAIADAPDFATLIDAIIAALEAAEAAFGPERREVAALGGRSIPPEASPNWRGHLRHNGAMPDVDAIGIVVSDLRRAVSFYRALGLAFPEGVEESEHGHAEVALTGGMRLMLDTEAGIRSFDPGWQRSSGSPGMSVAIRCESPAAVDELFDKAVAAGAETHQEPWDAFWGQRYAQLRDPDGNAIDLYAASSSRPADSSVAAGRQTVHLFAGIPVKDFTKSLTWYERLLGFPPSMFPHDREAVWELADHRMVYIVQRPERAGNALHTVMVDDLDSRVGQISQRGLEPVSLETYSNGVRKITYVDPDGNEIAFGAVPAG